MRNVTCAIIFLCLIAGFCPTVEAQQVQVSFNNQNPYALTPEMLMGLSLTSYLPNDERVYIEGEVSGSNGVEVMNFRSLDFILRPGMNVTTPALPGINYKRFSDPALQVYTEQYGSFPSGDYTYCIRVFKYETRSQLGLLCDRSRLQPTPPQLIYPTNGEELETQLPVLSWHGPTPFPVGEQLDYELKLVEVFKGQSINAAIVENPAILHRKHLASEALPYPGEARELQRGKLYAWQVLAYTGGRFLGKTEVWSFRITEKKKEEKPKNAGNYVPLRKEPDAGFTICTNVVKFKVDGNYAFGLPAVVLYDQQRRNVTPEGLDIRQYYGDNRFTIDLTDHKAFKNGEIYYLELQNEANEKLVMRFRYIRDKHTQAPKKERKLLRKDH